MLDDTRAAVFAELNRAVGAPAVNDNDFIRPCDAVKSRTYVFFFVLGNEDGRDLFARFHMEDYNSTSPDALRYFKSAPSAAVSNQHSQVTA